jgi:hypothetical protein
MKRILIASMMALVVAAAAATPAGAANNSANAKLCQKNGWKTVFRSDGTTFANQGACVSYGAEGKTILTNPWQAACVQNGGNFSVSISPSGFRYECTPVSVDTWRNVLAPICGAFPDVRLNGYSRISSLAVCSGAG